MSATGLFQILKTECECGDRSSVLQNKLMALKFFIIQVTLAILQFKSIVNKLLLTCQFSMNNNIIYKNTVKFYTYGTK